MNRLLLVTLITFLFTGQLLAQQQLNVNATPANGSGKFYYGDQNEPPRAVEFVDGAVAVSDFIANINRYLDIPSGFTFTPVESNTDNIGMRHHLLQQYYNGIPLEGLVYRVHEKNGFVRSANGKAIRKITIDTQITLSEAEAFGLAKSLLNSTDTTHRHGTKLIVSKRFTFSPESFSVAYQFDIDVSFIERWRVSIDARTGEIINKVSRVNSCFNDEHPPVPYAKGTGLTKYYGRQTIGIEKVGSTSRLLGQTANGVTIATYDFRNQSPEALNWHWAEGYHIYSNDTTFNDKAAVSVQWAGEKAHAYYLNKHGRNSYNNRGWPISSYVHVGYYYDNAFWTGLEMGFGDGSNNNPLVQLDVFGHELTHGVTDYEANLNYFYESGALNESFSDIFGKAMEFEFFGDTASWILAKQFRPGGLRNMSNPNLQNQPDTYKGHLWHTAETDNGGVHYNSGVQNYWFYLLCEGGSGVNDLNMSYDVDAIGMEAATKIAYRNLSEYLSYSSDYLDARIGSMLSAADLYGKNSEEYNQVDKAWDAVGVIADPIIYTLDFYDITATSVKINGTLQPRGDTLTYYFEYGPTPALGNTSSTYGYTDKVTGILTGLQPSTKYYVKLVATNESGSSSFDATFTTISLAPLVKIKQTVDVSESAASLYGQVNPNSLATSYHFEYGLTTAYGSVTPSLPLSSATEFINVSADVSGLDTRETYYYRLVATNAFSTSVTEATSFFTATRPVITSYSPASGNVGSDVTIAGQNFNPIAEKNVVSFGATRAQIISSNPTEIKVKVPAGASLNTISVRDSESGLMAESVQEFVPTFSGEFNNSSLQLRAGTREYIYQTLVEDMDGDGKPDILARHYLGFSVYINVNQGGDITDESFVKNTFNAVLTPGWISLADFDGNGLKDIITMYDRSTRIYPNLSVPGFVFFGAPIDLPDSYFMDLVVQDFDLDGHVDIAATVDLPGDETELVVLRNQNPKGFLTTDNFVRSYSIQLPYHIYNLYSDDLNNDGKPDVLSGVYNKDYVAVLRNNSSPDALDFVVNDVQNFTIERNPRYVSQDLNEDGWKDVVSYSSASTSNMVFLENDGTSPIISTKAAVVALSATTESIVQPGDIDGDGKVDLLIGTDDGKFTMLKNKTVPDGALLATSFEKFSEFGSTNVDVNSHTSITINDLNGDGRPEVINTYSYSRLMHEGFQMEIWQNSSDECIDPTLVTLSVSAATVTIHLPSGTTADQFEFEYSLGDGTWWRLYSTTWYVTQGYDYQFRVRAKCHLGYTGYHFINFTAECVGTESFIINGIGVDWVSFTANDIGALEVEYSVEGQEQWIAVPRFIGQVYDLLPGTTYDLRYRGRCPKPSAFKYKSFTTQCPKLLSLAMTDVTYDQASVSFSKSHEGDAIIEYSAAGVNWTVVDQNGIITGLTPGKQYQVRGRFKCNDVDSDFLYTSFSTSCPALVGLLVEAITPFSARVRWVDETNTGRYTVRYFSRQGEVPTIVETTSTFLDIDGLTAGTVYDVEVTPYCENGNSDLPLMTSFVTVCYAPFNLRANNVTYTTAELTWSDNYDGMTYYVEFGVAGRDTWQTLETTSLSLSLTNLMPASQYEVRIHILCSDETAPSVSMRFNTKAYVATTLGPNPTDGSITIHPSKDLTGRRFTIVDNAGKIVVDGVLADYTLDLSAFSPGVYILRIEGEIPVKIFKNQRL